MVGSRGLHGYNIVSDLHINKIRTHFSFICLHSRYRSSSIINRTSAARMIAPPTDTPITTFDDDDVISIVAASVPPFDAVSVSTPIATQKQKTEYKKVCYPWDHDSIISSHVHIGPPLGRN